MERNKHCFMHNLTSKLKNSALLIQPLNKVVQSLVAAEVKEFYGTF